MTTTTTNLATLYAIAADTLGVMPRHIAGSVTLRNKVGLPEADDLTVREATRIFRGEVDATLALANGPQPTAAGVAKTAAKKLVKAVTTDTQVVRSVFRATLFDHPVTAVIRWMGREGWNYEDAAVALATLGCAKTAPATIRAQLLAGRKGERGPAAELTKAQAKQLTKASK